MAESAGGGLTTGSAVSASGGLESQQLKGQDFLAFFIMKSWVYILQTKTSVEKLIKILKDLGELFGHLNAQVEAKQ